MGGVHCFDSHKTNNYPIITFKHPVTNVSQILWKVYKMRARYHSCPQANDCVHYSSFNKTNPSSRLATSWAVRGSNPGGGEIFRTCPDRPWAHPVSCKMGTGSFPGVKSGRCVTLTPHPLLVPWSRKSRAIPLLPFWAVRPLQSLSACTRVHFTFTYLNPWLDAIHWYFLYRIHWKVQKLQAEMHSFFYTFSVPDGKPQTERDGYTEDVST